MMPAQDCCVGGVTTIVEFACGREASEPLPFCCTAIDFDPDEDDCVKGLALSILPLSLPMPLGVRAVLWHLDMLAEVSSGPPPVPQHTGVADLSPTSVALTSAGAASALDMLLWVLEKLECGCGKALLLARKC